MTNYKLKTNPGQAIRARAMDKVLERRAEILGYNNENPKIGPAEEKFCQAYVANWATATITSIAKKLRITESKALEYSKSPNVLLRIDQLKNQRGIGPVTAEELTHKLREISEIHKTSDKTTSLQAINTLAKLHGFLSNDGTQVHKHVLLTGDYDADTERLGNASRAKSLAVQPIIEIPHTKDNQDEKSTPTTDE